MTTKKPPMIPVQPMQNIIIVDRINIDSKIVKDQKKKNPNVVLNKEVIANLEKEKIDKGEFLSLYDEHPNQAIILAIDEQQAKTNNLKVGDKIAFRVYENSAMVILFNKKKYLGIYPHDILFKYLTKEV